MKIKKTFGRCLISTFILITQQITLNSLKPHEEWWTFNVPLIPETLNNWLGDADATSRVFARDYIKKTNYKTILDVPCGTCVDYLAFKRDCSTIDYTGLDITEILVSQARNYGANAHKGSIEAIPFPDSSFDVVYSRHILEHLSYYNAAINELIRVAAKEVFIIFFIIPSSEPDQIERTEDRKAILYHNHYNKEMLEQAIMNNRKVKSISWDYLGDTNCGQETILHIYINS